MGAWAQHCGGWGRRRGEASVPHKIILFIYNCYNQVYLERIRGQSSEKMEEKSKQIHKNKKQIP
jgi:hypothetical protein